MKTCYTKEQDDWLRENISKYTYKELTVAFNSQFQTNKNYYTLKSHCANILKLKSGKPANKGIRNWRNAPIGTERIGSNGRIMVKVSNIPTSRETKNHSLNWTEKGRYVWEQHHGKIPEGHNIVYLDGNPLNCDISNLECTSISIQGKVSMSFNGCTPEIKRCAIKMNTLEKILEGIGATYGT